MIIMFRVLALKTYFIYYLIFRFLNKLYTYLQNIKIILDTPTLRKLQGNVWELSCNNSAMRKASFRLYTSLSLSCVFPSLRTRRT
jgi:hypothetical protein